MFVPGHSQYTRCPECGGIVTVEELDAHVCDEDRWVEHQMFLLRWDVVRFDEEVAAYLASPHGRFERWYAERERKLQRTPSLLR